MMISSHLHRLGGFLLAVALFPAGARAQTPAHSFEELLRSLKAEEIVVVFDKAGRETPGKVAEVSTSALILVVPEKTPEGLWAWTPGVRRSFAEASVAEILRSDLSGRKGTRIYSSLTPSFQTSATTFSELARLVTPGTTVIVTDRTGDSVTGRLASTTERSLALAGRSRTFAEGDLKEVRARVRDTDTLLDGAAIGFGVGFGGFALAGCKNVDSSETSYCMGLALLLGGLPGLGIGLATDAAGTHQVTVFRARANGPSARVTLEPVIGGKALGLRATVRY